MSRATLDVSRSDEIVDFIKNEVLPRVKETGATKGYWFLDRSSGKGGTLILFETEQQLRDSGPTAAQLRDASQRFGATFDTVEEFEIVAEL